jgi:Uma2 family endonuclease
MVTRAPATATALWPPDDTEESILGVDRHQLDIFSLRGGINEEAHRRAAGGPRAWQAISQIQLLGCQRRDGSPYTVIPDVIVFPRPMAIDRGSYSLQADGPPVLVIEVASESTFRADLDVQRGKGWTYRQAGVREYLVLDPSARLVPELGRGWQLIDGAYQPWTTNERGQWGSEAIGVAIGVDDGLAAVYGSDGRRRLREGEIEDTLESRYSEGRQEGRQEGRAEGVRAAVRRLARRRFGVVAALEARIDAADAEGLDVLLDRLLTATDPADL